MVTTEVLLMYTQAILLTVTSVTGIISLVITIAEHFAKQSDEKNKRKK